MAWLTTRIRPTDVDVDSAEVAGRKSCFSVLSYTVFIPRWPTCKSIMTADTTRANGGSFCGWVSFAFVGGQLSFRGVALCCWFCTSSAGYFRSSAVDEFFGSKSEFLFTMSANLCRSSCWRIGSSRAGSD